MLPGIYEKSKIFHTRTVKIIPSEFLRDIV